MKIEYRNWLNGLPPARTKLDIGGWAGESTWSSPQPWHCKPWSDYATRGLEIVYNWDTTCTVTCDEKGYSHFEGDFSKEKPEYLGPDWEPFAAFAPWHFGYVSMVDIKTPPNHNLFLMPHPRAFSDKDGSVPVAVPGMLEMDWWPEIFFMVFKAPFPGHKYVFKKGDPIAQFLILPREVKYDIQPMSEAEAELRATRQHNLEKKWHRLCTRVFYCEDDKEFFDNKYKVLSAMAKREGVDKVESIMDKPKSCPHYRQNPQIVDHRPIDKQVARHNPWPEDKIMREAKPVEIEEELPVEELGEEVEKLLPNLDTMNDDEFNRLIVAFKQQRRKSRQERSMKVKSQSEPRKAIKVPEVDPKPIDPRKIVKEEPPPKDDKEEWVLGHKIEKLK